MYENKLEGPVPVISTLKRREIQSPLLACVLDGFIKEIGYKKTMQVASAAIQQDAAKVWQNDGREIRREFIQGADPDGKRGLGRRRRLRI